MNLTSYGLGVALVLALPASSSAQRPEKPVIDREPVLRRGNPTSDPDPGTNPDSAGNAGNAGTLGNAGNAGNAGTLGNAGNAGTLGNAGPPAEGQVKPDACYLEYERADNGWAAHGRPDGDLGKEYIVLARGQYKEFVTNWANEKRRATGTVFYGSHLRRATNQGTREIELRVRTSPVTTHVETLMPGLPLSFRADLARVWCTP